LGGRAGGKLRFRANFSIWWTKNYENDFIFHGFGVFLIWCPLQNKYKINWRPSGYPVKLKFLNNHL